MEGDEVVTAVIEEGSGLIEGLLRAAVEEVLAVLAVFSPGTEGVKAKVVLGMPWGGVTKRLRRTFMMTIRPWKSPFSVQIYSSSDNEDAEQPDVDLIDDVSSFDIDPGENSGYISNLTSDTDGESKMHGTDDVLIGVSPFDNSPGDHTDDVSDLLFNIGNDDGEENQTVVDVGESSFDNVTGDCAEHMSGLKCVPGSNDNLDE
ncbi:hypothetical protein CYMTET_33667 [Cymbomonas tetramitiformis]|uniref:Uncharacterized protein n=1 Tax=Cymbomonas tetramitiformis TaxID=36881 RepID=A0AAE0KQY8_9CHLO|nr:hypothetical protein CYMTET_33667 [Cymbomonas tetramitiformis]